MHIGQMARNAGVNIQTVRFYEREGLLPEPVRDSAGYRCYNSADFDRVTFIKRNQELGFSLTEIKQLLDLHAVLATMKPPFKGKEMNGILTIGRERLESINQKLRTLNGMRRQLTALVRQLEKVEVMTCPAAKSASRAHS